MNGGTIALWGFVAIWSYAMVWVLVAHALRPRPLPDPDWFYQGGTWTRSDQPGIVHGQYESFNPEPSDLQESEPESGVG